MRTMVLTISANYFFHHVDDMFMRSFVLHSRSLFLETALIPCIEHVITVYSDILITYSMIKYAIHFTTNHWILLTLIWFPPIFDGLKTLTIFVFRTMWLFSLPESIFFFFTSERILKLLLCSRSCSFYFFIFSFRSAYLFISFSIWSILLIRIFSEVVNYRPLLKPRTVSVATSS